MTTTTITNIAGRWVLFLLLTGLSQCSSNLCKKCVFPKVLVFLDCRFSFIFGTNTVLPALRANSCIAIDRLMIELLDFHIPFLSFTNAGFKGYGKNLLNRRLRITQLP